MRPRSPSCRPTGDSDFGGHLAALVIPVCGDMNEGSASHGGKLPNDLGVTEQVRAVR
jgi:hypothetical protein